MTWRNIGITREVPPSAVDDLELDDGGELWAWVSPAAVTVYDRWPDTPHDGSGDGDGDSHGDAVRSFPHG